MGSSIQISGGSRAVLGDPEFRRHVLREIHLRPTSDASGLLREILSLEAADRASGDNPDFYENLYWCAYLVWRLKRVEDVRALWRAKNTNFDTGAGFDVQFLTGAGVEETIRYLLAQSDPESSAAAAHLLKRRDAGDFDALEDWAVWREGYFAGMADPA
jgi:hypothetical protein